MKKDYHELTGKLNDFRMKAQKELKSFTASELSESLQKLGFNRVVAAILANKCFPFETLNGKRLYEAPKVPIHENIIVAAYAHVNDYNKKKRTIVSSKKEVGKDNFKEGMEVQNAIKLLHSKGYKIYKPAGFNMKKFQEENADLYKKYIVYDSI